MNRSTFAAAVSTIVLFLTATGFQCGSAESTSAKLYMQRKDWPAAEAALVKEVENNPANGEAWYLLGQVRLRKSEQSMANGNFPQVKTDLENMLYAYNKSLAATPDFQPQIDTERLFAWQKALNAGVELFNRSLKAPEADAPAVRSDALLMYDAAIAVQPDSLLPYKNAAIALQAGGDVDRQLVYLRKAAALSPDPGLQTQIIVLLIDRGDRKKAAGDDAGAAAEYDQALEELKRARSTAPDDPDLLNAMIDLYIKVDRASDAVPLMQEGLRRDPKNRDYHYNLGVLLMQEGRNADAITHFDAALETDPSYTFALQNAGTANLKIADEMKRASQSDDPRRSGGRAYVEYFKKAASYFERLTALTPDDPNAWDFYGSAAANAGMLKEAEAAIAKADALRKK